MHTGPSTTTLSFLSSITGTENEVRSFQFNETIVYPENPSKEGHTFNGWSPRPVRMPAKDITVTAQWIEKPTEFVEIVFGKKDLKEEEVREIIKKYSDSEFIIVKVEDDEAGGTRVIIKFVDKDAAVSFVEEIRASSNTKSSIRKVGFIYGEVDSFSFSLCPLYLFGAILYF